MSFVATSKNEINYGSTVLFLLKLPLSMCCSSRSSPRVKRIGLGLD